MIKGKIECSNAPKEKVIRCLAEFGASFPFEFDGLAHDKRVLIIFKLDSVSAFKELIKRLKRIKGIRLEYSTDQDDTNEL
jgi:hypothetical protein